MYVLRLYITYSFYRGKEFCKDFAGLGCLRSLFNTQPFLALTATAPKKIIKNITCSLVMKNPSVIVTNPNRRNIFLAKYVKKDTFYGTNAYDDILFPISSNLLKNGTEYPQTVIYSHLKYCGYAYKLFKSVLGNKQYAGQIKKPTSSLFVQLHAEQTDRMKEEILREITKLHSQIRVIFATSALGMGLNAPFIERIIHLSPPSSLEAYMQEFGRAGGSGKPSKAILYYAKSEISDYKILKKLINSAMVEYCNTDGCLRKNILEHFGFSYEKQDDCCSNCCPKFETDVGETPKPVTNCKHRKISEESFHQLAFDFNELLANYDLETGEEEVVYNMFLVKETSSELSKKIMIILDNIEYFKDKDSFKKYDIFQEDIIVRIMTLIEKHTENLE